MGLLQPESGLLFWMVISFGVVFVLLAKFGFPVITRMVEELKRAERYIFVEYFIIEEGKMWDTILDILKDKAQEGVDVRVMYDDIGSMFTLPRDYARELEARTGIKCCAHKSRVWIGRQTRRKRRVLRSSWKE